MSKGFDYFLWGMLGGALVDGPEFVKLIRANRGRFPKGFWSVGYILGETVRLLIGAALAMIFAVSGQIPTPLAGVTVGMTAPYDY